jgi:5-methylcytosine-specific restriction endonuclease McrA
MKFELEPYNRGESDDTLLNDLRCVARSIGKDYLTQAEYDARGRWCAATSKKRFGSWCKAHELAGLREIRNYSATAEDCIEELKRVATELGTTALTKREYDVHGRFSSELICRRCGSWKAASERAGLRATIPYPSGIPDEELFENLEGLWESLGRQPRITDFVKPGSKYSGATYSNRFGSFRRALEAFVASFEDQQRQEPQEHQKETAPKTVSACVRKAHRTSRTVSWRTRFLVMRRDHFKCCICGVSPALKPGTVLVVDHIFPWIEGGETVMENLQTLCEPCNGGKSTLLMEED